jgi:hypothetical protein
MTKNQKLLTLSAIVVAVTFLLFGCGTAVNNEVKTDSTLKDSVIVDTLTIDTTKVYGERNQAIK